jgi:hypothetical protein
VVAVVIDAVDHVSGDSVVEQEVELRLAVALVSDTDDRGFQTDHRLSIELVELAGTFIALAAAAGIDVETLTAQVKAVLDRTVPFGVASGQAVQRAETRIHPLTGSAPAAFGVYIDLVLKDGPEPDAFVADRGDAAGAQNFLTFDADLAFATAPGLFALLGPDLRHRMAEQDDDGDFVYRLREDPGDPESAEIGDLEDIDVGPELVPLSTQPTGKMLVHIDGNYDLDVLPDPDLDVFLTFDPRVTDGLLGWEVDAGVDVGILGSIVGTVLVIAGAVFLGPGVGVTIFLLLVAADVVTDALVTAVAAQRIEEGADASFLDALPHRVTVMERRWDPLYVTRHQVVTLIDDGVVINASGIAFDGRATLDKQPAAITDAVIRDEDRDGAGDITALRSRVSDLAEIAAGLTAIAPGTDRRPFLPADAARPTLVGLTREQIAERIEEERLVHPIAYVPRMIELEDHHIRLMLLISRREIDEQRRRLIRELRRATDNEIRADLTDIEAEETDRLRTALGRDPTADELTDAVDARVSALVDAAQAEYEEGALAADLDAAITAILSLDLAPDELADLQDAACWSWRARRSSTCAAGPSTTATGRTSTPRTTSCPFRTTTRRMSPRRRSPHFDQPRGVAAPEILAPSPKGEVR